MALPFPLHKHTLRALVCAGALAWGSGPAWANPPDAPAPRRPFLARLTRTLVPGFLAWLACHDPSLQAAGQPMLPPMFLTPLPPINLSATDPATVFAAASVNHALAQANTTGVLPPLQALNAILASNNRQGTAILATLPAPTPMAAGAGGLDPEDQLVPFPSAPMASQDGTSVPGPVEVAPPFEGTDPFLVTPGLFFANGESTMVAPEAPLQAEVDAARDSVEAAKFYEAYYMMAAVSFELQALPYLINDTAVGNALNFASYQLLSVAHWSGAIGSQDQLVAAQRTLDLLVNKTQSRAPKPGTAPGPGLAGLPATILTPEFIYGVWQRVAMPQTTSQIVYRFNRQEFRKINVTTADNGDMTMETEIHPGAVVGSLRATVPAGTTLADATANGRVQVTVLVEKVHGNPIIMNFTFYNRTFGASGTSLQVLMENEEGRQSLFVKLPDV